MRISLKQVIFFITLTVAVYSTLELFKFKSVQYADLLNQISLARGAASSEPVDGDNEVFVENPVFENQYSDIEPEAQPTREVQGPLKDHEMLVMMESMKAMSHELEILKQGGGSSNDAGVDAGFDKYEHERQGCNIRMADRGEFTNLPLLSFPGSGNTWTRYLIEQVSGVYTVSVYHDGGLYNHGHFRGEMEDPFNGTTIVQKVHRVGSNGYSGRMFRGTQKAAYCLFLLRDPRYAFKSEFSRLHTKSHMGKITQADLEGKYKSEWESQVSRWVFSYVDAYDAAMKGGACRDGLHMIFYEKLKESDEMLVKEAQGIQKFIATANKHKNINFDSECLEKNGADGKYHRRNTDEFNFDVLFTEKQKAKLNYHLEELNKTLNYAIPGYYLFENVDMEAAGSPLEDFRRPRVRNSERKAVVSGARAGFDSLRGLMVESTTTEDPAKTAVTEGNPEDYDAAADDDEMSLNGERMVDELETEAPENDAEEAEFAAEIEADILLDAPERHETAAFVEPETAKHEETLFIHSFKQQQDEKSDDYRAAQASVLDKISGEHKIENAMYDHLLGSDSPVENSSTNQLTEKEVAAINIPVETHVASPVPGAENAKPIDHMELLKQMDPEFIAKFLAQNLAQPLHDKAILEQKVEEKAEAQLENPSVLAAREAAHQRFLRSVEEKAAAKDAMHTVIAAKEAMVLAAKEAAHQRILGAIRMNSPADLIPVNLPANSGFHSVANQGFNPRAGKVHADM